MKRLHWQLLFPIFWLVKIGALATPGSQVFFDVNNVQGEVGTPGVVLLGVMDSVTACEGLCMNYSSGVCFSFTWHHLDFEKEQYRGHCYGHTNVIWSPRFQSKIDSGCRTDLAPDKPHPNCSVPPVRPSPPPPTMPNSKCSKDFDCSGSLGSCINGVCECYQGWTGNLCGQMKLKNGRVAYADPLWTWGGSPIVDDDGIVHLFSSRMSNNCGILHYCLNSEVIHLVSPNGTGPFKFVDVALAPRNNMWDNGAIHGISVHRLPNGTYALFYMGTEMPDNKHPNCTAGSGDSTANITTGSHDGRRIGIALSDSLNGPWSRLSKPLFGPDPAAWDNIDVSNPSPIIHPNGSVIMLYKGRGRSKQSMGMAFADSVDGPYRRNNSGKTSPDLPGEDPWGWVDDKTGVYHAVFHTDNGVDHAGSHRWSRDGIVWYGDGTDPVYTGRMDWANDTLPPYRGTTTVLARRERPQILLDGKPGSSYGQPLVLFTSAEDCYPGRGMADGGRGDPCGPPSTPLSKFTTKSYTVLAEIDR